MARSGRTGHGQLHRVYPDAPLAGGGGVEERCLHAARRRRERILLVANLDGERLILVDVGQCEQVGAPDEKVAVEGGDAQPARDTHPHDGFPALVARERVLQVARELLALADVGEGGVVVDSTRRVPVSYTHLTLPTICSV
eukprot:1842464-Prymnesium_polylepis.1